jgi:peptide/nickel transport system substrate-binding protein
MRQRRWAWLLAVGVLLAAACGGDDDGGGASSEGSDGSGGSASSDAEASAENATPSEDDVCTEDRAGGEITMGVQIMALGIDPTVALGTGVAGATEITAVYDTLMRYDPETGEIVPHVAESLEPNDDFTQWTLTLQDGITFGNGDPLTAEAVAFSVDRLKNATVAASGMAQEVASMEVVDDLTVVFDMVEPWGGFPYLLASEGGMVTNPAVVSALGEGFPNDPVGAGVGPFEVERFAPGEEIVLTGKDDYWGGPVCLDTLRFVSVPGGDATYEAFQTGELDVAFMSEARPVAAANEDGVTGYAAISGGQGYLLNGGRGDAPVLADERLRQAIAHAIDPEVINQRVFDGTALPASGLTHPDQRIYPDVDGPEYDPDLATELVEEVKAEGEWDGSVRITCGDNPAAVEQSVTVEAMLETVGFEVEVESLSVDQSNQRVLFDGDFDIGCGASSIFDEGPVRGMNQFLTESVRNRTGIGSPELDAGIQALYQAADEEATRDAMGEIQTAFNELVPAVNVVSAEWFVGWQDSVHGINMNRESSAMFHDAWVE